MLQQCIMRKQNELYEQLLHSIAFNIHTTPQKCKCSSGHITVGNIQVAVLVWLSIYAYLYSACDFFLDKIIKIKIMYGCFTE